MVPGFSLSLFSARFGGLLFEDLPMTDQTTTIADLALSQSAFLVSQAVVELDAMFGEGYAAARPPDWLGAGLLQAAQGASH